VNALKSIATVYVALYLILPTCLCQVVGAFGGETHHHHQVDSSSQPLEVDAAIGLGSQVCFCEHDCTKEAELAVVESGVPDPVSVSSAVTQRVEVPSMASLQQVSNSRGPPDLAFRWSSAPCSGVFRL
jgi:hypothetical protein